MTEAPIVGRYYLVPTIYAQWMGVDAAWPVVGHEHDDVVWFNFPYRHYRVDGRFLTATQRRNATDYMWEGNSLEALSRACTGSPLQTNDRGTNPDGLPKPVHMRKRCAIAAIPLAPRIIAAETWRKMAEHYAGHQCRSTKRGFICPHQNFSLGSVAAVNGVITCPLHGLRVDAVTGFVLPPPPIENKPA